MTTHSPLAFTSVARHRHAAAALIRVGAAAVPALLLASAPSSVSATTPPPEPSAPIPTSAEFDEQTITIGFISPLTGPAAPAFASMEDGANAAVDYLNSGNARARGVTYELEVRDSGADPNRDVVIIREFLDAGVPMVLGDVGSTQGFIAEQAAINDGASTIAFTSSPSVNIWTEAGADRDFPWAFGITGDDHDFVQPVFDAAAALTENAHIAQISLDTGTAPTWRDRTEELAEQAGLELDTAEVSPTITDATAQLRDLQDSGADTLVVWAYGTSLQTILSNLDRVGWYPNVVALPDSSRQEILDSVPADVMDQVVAGPLAATFLSADGGEPSGVAAGFLGALSTITGRGAGEYTESDFSAAYSFDAILAFDAALAAAGVVDAAAVRDVLDGGLVVEGAMGPHDWIEDRAGFDGAATGIFDPQEPCNQGTCVAVEIGS